ncbi:MAG: thioredoxin family protein, partial [Acidobacteria bacterium]|nr:thioredoxin family protein [Acidobacteriota bacterium]
MLRVSPRLFAWTLLMAVAAAVPAMAQLRRIPAEITPLVESDGVRAGASVRAALAVVLPDGYHVQSNKPRDPLLIATELTLDAPDGLQVEELVFPAATDFAQEGLDEPLLVFDREFVIGVRLGLAGRLSPGELVVPGRLRYQACDNKMCYAPSTVPVEWTLKVVGAGATVTPRHTDVIDAIAFGTGEKPGASPAPAAPAAAPAAAADGGIGQLERFTVVATTGGYLGSDDFLTFIGNAESGVTEQGLFEGRGPLAIILIVLLGGLALNLTPCVLPMIPINLAIIGAGAQAASRKRGFLLGLTYGGAMAFVYGALGLIVVLTASTFGTINASPWFNVAIAVLFVALALAMFDVITIDFSSLSGSLGSGAGRGTFVLAFTMGAVAALLAGACVAPVVIQVVLFSTNLYATGTTIALALPFFLGIGMAIPWPLAGAGLTALPRPGPWMVRVKQVFGVLILGTAVYYGYIAYGLFANRWVDASEVASSVEEKLKEGWHASLADGLAAAEREGKPVLIDMWATWCKNCLTMDKTTLSD